MSIASINKNNHLYDNINYDILCDVKIKMKQKFNLHFGVIINYQEAGNTVYPFDDFLCRMIFNHKKTEYEVKKGKVAEAVTTDVCSGDILNGEILMHYMNINYLTDMI